MAVSTLTFYGRGTYIGSSTPRRLFLHKPRVIVGLPTASGIILDVELDKKWRRPGRFHHLIVNVSGSHSMAVRDGVVLATIGPLKCRKVYWDGTNFHFGAEKDYDAGSALP